MASERIENAVQIKTSTLVVIAMIAGVGLAQLEVSAWVSTALDIASVLFERVTDVIAAFFGTEKP